MDELYTPVHTNPVEILRWVSLAITIITLLLIVYSMLRDVPFAAKPAGKITLFFAIGLFPVITTFFTDMALFDEMKEVEFCGSCHVMKPFVEGLKDPQSGGLAAVHVQHARIREAPCYTCHTDYSLLGGIKSKMNGMHHLFAYYTKYMGQTKERPKLYKPFPNENCFSCHMKSSTWILTEEHVDNLDDIVSGDVSCLECHGPSHPK